MQRTAEATAINNLNHPLGFIVNRTAYVLRLRMRERLQLEGCRLTPEELAIIHHLWQEDGQTQSQLASSTIRERTTTTRILDGLVLDPCRLPQPPMDVSCSGKLGTEFGTEFGTEKRCRPTRTVVAA